jgi:hypothetical protein
MCGEAREVMEQGKMQVFSRRAVVGVRWVGWVNVS